MTVSLDGALNALQKALPDGFDGRVNFDITDLGWIFLDATGARVGKGQADIVLRADTATFVAIISGTQEPATLYFSGRLQIEGNLGVAIQLGRQL